MTPTTTNTPKNGLNYQIVFDSAHEILIDRSTYNDRKNPRTRLYDSKKEDIFLSIDSDDGEGTVIVELTKEESLAIANHILQLIYADRAASPTSKE